MSTLKKALSSTNKLTKQRQVQERPANKPMIILRALNKVKELFNNSDVITLNAYNSIFTK